MSSQERPNISRIYRKSTSHDFRLLIDAGLKVSHFCEDLHWRFLLQEIVHLGLHILRQLDITSGCVSDFLATVITFANEDISEVRRSEINLHLKQEKYG